MPSAASIANQVAAAKSWDARVAIIRKVPDDFGLTQQMDVYAAIAELVYVPTVTPEFGYVHWRADYELQPLEWAYKRAFDLTAGFTNVSPAGLAAALVHEPRTLQVFRLMLGLTQPELAEACALVAGTPGFKKTAVQSMEGGRAAGPDVAEICANVIDSMMNGALFPPVPGPDLRSKIEKPDTLAGWDSIRSYAASGVPLPMFLHQRAYGGAFRQLLDATSTRRGDLLEDPVEELFKDNGVPYLRTGSSNQGEIRTRFGIRVAPAPDFVVFDNRTDTLKAILESKGANDGGTARDKAARFGKLKEEAGKHGGIPVFAVLGGVGWRRTRDALGPVIEATDGRVFTLANLPEILTCEPFPGLIGLVT